MRWSVWLDRCLAFGSLHPCSAVLSTETTSAPLAGCLRCLVQSYFWPSSHSSDAGGCVEFEIALTCLFVHRDLESSRLSHRADPTYRSPGSRTVSYTHL